MQNPKFPSNSEGCNIDSEPTILILVKVAWFGGGVGGGGGRCLNLDSNSWPFDPESGA